MPVNVCGHLNIRVSHVFLNVFQRKSVIQKQARAAMPEFMETNMRQMVVFQKKRKMGGYIVRRKRLAVGPLEDKIILLIFIAAELAIYPLSGFCLEKNSLASCVKGKERWLELFFVLSLQTAVVTFDTVCLIVSRPAVKSTLSHFRPRTSLRRIPYRAVIFTRG